VGVVEPLDLAPLARDAEANDPGVVRALAQVARRAYLPPCAPDGSPLADGKACERDGVTEIPFVHAFDVATGAVESQALIVHDDHAVVLAFRGSDNVTDWLTNLHFTMSPVYPDGSAAPGALVHQGFRRALWSTWPRIRTRVEALVAEGRRLWLTGHSLGASLSSIAAFDLAKTGGDVPVAGLVTFGQPRTGNDIFCTALDAMLAGRYARIVHGGDLVVLLPPERFGYRHAGTRHSLTTAGTLTADPLTEEGEVWHLFPDLVQAMTDAEGYLAAAQLAAQLLGRGQTMEQRVAACVAAFRELLPAPLADHDRDAYWTALSTERVT
jgi:hypothetical protein